MKNNIMEKLSKLDSDNNNRALEFNNNISKENEDYSMNNKKSKNNKVLEIAKMFSKHKESNNSISYNNDDNVKNYVNSSFKSEKILKIVDKLNENSNKKTEKNENKSNIKENCNPSFFNFDEDKNDFFDDTTNNDNQNQISNKENNENEPYKLTVEDGNEYLFIMENNEKKSNNTNDMVMVNQKGNNEDEIEEKENIVPLPNKMVKLKSYQTNDKKKVDNLTSLYKKNNDAKCKSFCINFSKCIIF